VRDNVGRIEASGKFGELVVELRGQPTAQNPKTSAVMAFSILRAIENQSNTIVI